MDEKTRKQLLPKRNKARNIHLLIIISSIPQIILGFIYYKICLFNNHIYFFLINLTLFLLISLIIFLFSSSPEKKQNLIGVSLCIIFSFSISMTFFTSSKYYPLYIYFITLCIYHYTEYFSVLLYHFEKLNYEYFLIDQSIGWVIATLVSFLETFLGIYYFDKYKKIKIFFIIGFIMMVFGQFMRIGALYTGKKNFTHRIQFDKVEGHKLITHGVFAISRHPSYFGFYLWSLGIEIMCCNPLCSIAFAVVLFQFFKKRILIEEQTLIQFFGEEYLEYKAKVGILIPFIHLEKEKEEKSLKIFHKNKNMNINKSIFS